MAQATWGIVRQSLVKRERMREAYVIRGEPDRNHVARIAAHVHDVPPNRIYEVIRRVACTANDRERVLSNAVSACTASTSEGSTHAMQMHWVLHIERES